MVSEACPTNPREEASGLDPEAVHIGTDAEPGNRDHLDGRIYEVRLYYKAFSDEQVRTLTDAMSP